MPCFESILILRNFQYSEFDTNGINLYYFWRLDDMASQSGLIILLSGLIITYMRSDQRLLIPVN